MRAGNFPKQEECNRTDSVEGKNNKAGGTNQDRNGAHWDTDVLKSNPWGFQENLGGI